MNSRGFTLIEIIIVIVILGILATIALPKITGQMEASRASEAMNIFGTLRRAASDCYDMANSTNTNCLTKAQLGVDIPSPANGASFTYSASLNGTGAEILFKAVRPVSGTANAICQRVYLDNSAKVAYAVFPGTSVFAGIVTRTGSSVGGAAANGCADAVSLTTLLNN